MSDPTGNGSKPTPSRWTPTVPTMTGGGPGRLQQWLIFRAPSVLLVIGILAFIVGGVYVLAANPPNLHTTADQSYGTDEPMQASNVALAIIGFAGAVLLAVILGWWSWRLISDRHRRRRSDQ